MRQLTTAVVASLMVCALSVSPALAQGEFPRLVPFSGVADSNAPLSKPVAITFALYEEATGGASLFLETQFVTLQSNRQFQVLLGAATPGGLPASVFVANQALFVGVQVDGLPEQTTRVRFASVPYALKAADADALGGLPASEYVTEAEAGSGNAYTDAQVAAEAAARAAADSTLQNNIDAEAAARAQGDINSLAAANTYADGQVAAEAAARSAADTTLQSNIDAEAAARALGDINTLAAANTYADAQVAAEAAARSAADTTLQSNIDAEAAARAAADAMFISSLSGGVGISISGSGNSRMVTNTGDTNTADDITSLSGSGGVTVTGSGNSRTIGHSTWSCAAGSSIRTIDSSGTVTCEPDDVGGGGGSVTRSVNLPLGSFLNISGGATIDFTVSDGTAPDFKIVSDMVVIEFDGDTDDAGPDFADIHTIGSTLAVPPDYSSGGSLAIRVSKDAHTGPDELLSCTFAINGTLALSPDNEIISTAASAVYVLTPSQLTPYSIGDALTVRCFIRDGSFNFSQDNNVWIHSIEFRYTATP